MKYINLFSFLLVGSFIFISCDEFLQKDPPSSPSEASFWQKKSDFEYALTSCYSVVYDWPGVFSQAIPSYDNLTDNALCQFDESTYGSTKTMMLGDIYPTSSGFVYSNYTTAYKAIARCNLFLEKIESYQNKDISIDEKNYMIAQARGLRAYYYHWLFLCYKEVPLVIEFLGLEEQYQPKATREQLYNQIINDFSESARLLDESTYMDKPGRISKGACLAFMAKITMFHGFSNDSGIPIGVSRKDLMRNVVNYCEQINGYTLDSDIRTAFVESKQRGSTEMIFSARYGAPDFTNSANEYYAEWSSLMVQRNLVDAFECIDGLPWKESPLAQEVDENLINSLVADPDLIALEREKLFINRDKRLINSIIAARYYRFPELPGYPNNLVVYSGEPSFSGFGPLKFIQPFEQGQKPGGVKVGPDFNLMRYAHVLLMLAEAENECNGPTLKAYDAINKVRRRAAQPELPSNLSQDEFRERVRNEWRCETPFEGWRYFHLKQWNKLKTVPTIVAEEPLYTVSAVYEDRFIFWPIPQSEIDKANGILEQDPAYK